VLSFWCSKSGVLALVVGKVALHKAVEDPAGPEAHLRVEVAMVVRKRCTKILER